ncbi:MAG TPA: hypothetical protein PLO52_00410 [Flavobacterium alvei]|nr:hypothetical protein [Flavobacterium alvei]
MKGVPFGWFETGTEGTIWAIQDEKDASNKYWSYENLHIIKPGDRLKIIDKKTNEIVVDQDLQVVHSDGKMNLYGFWCHWLPIGIDHKLWAQIFLDENGKDNFLAELSRVTDE